MPLLRRVILVSTFHKSLHLIGSFGIITVTQPILSDPSKNFIGFDFPTSHGVKKCIHIILKYFECIR